MILYLYIYISGYFWKGFMEATLSEERARVGQRGYCYLFLDIECQEYGNEARWLTTAYEKLQRSIPFSFVLNL
jgi:hypothetical protein